MSDPLIQYETERDQAAAQGPQALAAFYQRARSVAGTCQPMPAASLPPASAQAASALVSAAIAPAATATARLTRAHVLEAIERGRAAVPALARTSAPRGTKPSPAPKQLPREMTPAQIRAVALKAGERYGQLAQGAYGLALPDVRQGHADAGRGWSKAADQAGLVRGEG